MQKNGFITSALLYGMLSLFLVLMLGSLAILSNRKFSMDKLKEASINDTNKNEEVEEVTTDIAYNYIANGKDFDEDGRYVYEGKNPSNYVRFNNETWRIISLEPDHTIKIMRNDSIGGKAYNEPKAGEDNSNILNWDASNSLHNYLNGEYLNDLSTNSLLLAYHNFDTGFITGENLTSADIKALVQNTTWNSKVGLINMSDYLNSNSDDQCRTFDGFNGKENCKETTYISDTLTLTTNGGNNNENNVYAITKEGYQEGYQLVGVENSYAVKPVVYLKSGVKISLEKEPSGEKDKPYIIS